MTTDEKTFWANADNYTANCIARKLGRTLKKFGLEHLLNDGPIVDLGCGAGYVATSFQNQFPNTQLIGVDVNFAGLQNARKLSMGGVYPIKADIKELPIADGSIPIAHSRLIYDFFNENTAQDLAREVFRILKRDGIYFVEDDMHKYKNHFTELGLEVIEEDFSYTIFKKKELPAI